MVVQFVYVFLFSLSPIFLCHKTIRTKVIFHPFYFLLFLYFIFSFKCELNREWNGSGTVSLEWKFKKHIKHIYIYCCQQANELLLKCSTGTSSFHNNGMEGEVISWRPTGCMCNLPIKKNVVNKTNGWQFSKYLDLYGLKKKWGLSLFSNRILSLALSYFFLLYGVFMLLTMHYNFKFSFLSFCISIWFYPRVISIYQICSYLTECYWIKWQRKWERIFFLILILNLQTSLWFKITSS